MAEVVARVRIGVGLEIEIVGRAARPRGAVPQPLLPFRVGIPSLENIVKVAGAQVVGPEDQVARGAGGQVVRRGELPVIEVEGIHQHAFRLVTRPYGERPQVGAGEVAAERDGYFSRGVAHLEQQDAHMGDVVAGALDGLGVHLGGGSGAELAVLWDVGAPRLGEEEGLRDAGEVVTVRVVHVAVAVVVDAVAGDLVLVGPDLSVQVGVVELYPRVQDGHRYRVGIAPLDLPGGRRAYVRPGHSRHASDGLPGVA